MSPSGKETRLLSEFLKVSSKLKNYQTNMNLVERHIINRKFTLIKKYYIYTFSLFNSVLWFLNWANGEAEAKDKH